MIRFLFVAVSSTRFITLFHVANYVKQSGKYEPLMLFISKYEGVEKDIKTCENNQIEFHFINRKKPPIPKKWSVSWFKEIIKEIIIYTLGHTFFLKIFYHIFLGYNFKNKTYKKIKRAYRAVIKKYNIRIIGLAQEVAGDLWTFVARELDIPLIVFPFTYTTPEKIAKNMLFKEENKVNYSLYNLWISKIYKHWVYEYKAKKCLRLKGPYIYALEALGVSNPRPWVMNSGPIDALAVESPKMLSFYKDQGIEEEKLKLIGQLTDDKLALVLKDKNNKKKDLYEKYLLKLKQPLLICALPPDQKYYLKTGFNDYKEIIEFWIKTLTELPKWNVVFKLHPRMNQKEIFDIIERYDATIADENTEELIPICDLYIASVSATIRWAIACGIPVINYDIYNYHYDDFRHMVGVKEVQDKEGFTSEVRKTTSENRYYAVLKKNQQKVKRDWGCLDGKVGERMISLINALIEKSDRVSRRLDD